MKYLKLKGILNVVFAFLFMGSSSIVFGQQLEQSILLPGPNGVHITTQKLFDYPILNNKRYFPSPDEKIVIWKLVEGKKDFQKIAEVSFPASAKEMQEKLGEKGTSLVFDKLNTNNMSEAYQLIEKYGVDTLGLTILSPIIQEAYGLNYIDASWEIGQKVTYRFDKVSPINVQENVHSESLDGQVPQYATKYKLTKYWAADSMGFAKWGSKIAEKEALPMYGQLYSMQNSETKFSIQGRVLLNRTESDSTYAVFSNAVLPNSRIAWFMRPMDRAGNLGTPSDTLYTLNFDKNKITPIENLRVADTLNGLLVAWKKLPPKAYYTAIQILKSRKLGGDYVVLDTIAPSKSAFMDKQVIPGSAYFYKVRPLLFDLPGLEPMVFTEASGYKGVSEDLLPSTPQGLQAVVKENKVALQWLPNPELNIFAYYVLRGTSLNNLKVISGPIKQHYYTDSTFNKSYSGQYAYAIQVLNNGQKMSDTSSVVSVSLRQPVVLLSPGGIQANYLDDGVNLQWENTRVKDNSIIGYVLYRREKGAQQYNLLESKPTALPAYLDLNTMSGKEYEYAVSSIDVWGNQSVLSPFVGVSTANKEYLNPPANISLRNLKAGIEVSWAKPYDAGTREYVIYRSTAKGTSFTKIATVNPTTPYIDKSVKGNTLYKYVVSVKSKDREGSKSSEQLIRRP